MEPQIHKVVVMVVTTDADGGLIQMDPKWQIGGLNETDANMISLGFGAFVQSNHGKVPGPVTDVGGRVPRRYELDPWPDGDPPSAMGVVTASVLNVRDKPSVTMGEIVGSFDHGAKVYIFEKFYNETEDRIWYRVAETRWGAAEWINIVQYVDANGNVRSGSPEGGSNGHD